MSEAVQILLTFAPVLLAVGASAAVWRRVTRPFLFLVVSTLALTGLQAIVAPAAVANLVLNGATTPMAAAGFQRSLAAAAMLVVLGGSALLFWLYRGMRRG